MAVNNIDKRLKYEERNEFADEIKNLVARKPIQLELPLEEPDTATIINFPLKPGSPILDWYKTSKDKFKQVVSVDDLAPFLSQFYSQKELLNMTELEVEHALQDLLDKGVL